MTEKEYKILLKDKLIEYRTSLNLTEDVTFGIEIEYENIVKDTVSYLLEYEQLDRRLIGWKNKSEIDIQEKNKLGEEVNGEINSPILTDNIDTWKNLRLVLNLLNKNNAIITEKCGGHVNIGAHILCNDMKYLKNLILLWILYEKEIYKFCSGEYEILRPDPDKIFQKISQDIDIKKILSTNGIIPFNRTINLSADRFHDICIHKPLKAQVMFGNVIEFRIPNGTLSEEMWQNYINFFAKFLIACKKELDMEKVLYKIKNNEHSAVELADYVFDNGIDKEYFLIQALKTNKVYKKELPPHITYN